MRDCARFKSTLEEFLGYTKVESYECRRVLTDLRFLFEHLFLELTQLAGVEIDRPTSTPLLLRVVQSIDDVGLSRFVKTTGMQLLDIVNPAVHADTDVSLQHVNRACFLFVEIVMLLKAMRIDLDVRSRLAAIIETSTWSKPAIADHLFQYIEKSPVRITTFKMDAASRNTIVHVAAMNGHFAGAAEFLRRLVAEPYGVQALSETNVIGWTPIFVAARVGALDAVKEMLTITDDIESQRDPHGRNVLMVALMPADDGVLIDPKGRVATAKYLLTHCSALALAQDHDGNTALHYAAMLQSSDHVAAPALWDLLISHSRSNVTNLERKRAVDVRNDVMRMQPGMSQNGMQQQGHVQQQMMTQQQVPQQQTVTQQPVPPLHVQNARPQQQTMTQQNAQPNVQRPRPQQQTVTQQQQTVTQQPPPFVPLSRPQQVNYQQMFHSQPITSQQAAAQPITSQPPGLQNPSNVFQQGRHVAPSAPLRQPLQRKTSDNFSPFSANDTDWEADAFDDTHISSQNSSQSSQQSSQNPFQNSSQASHVRLSPAAGLLAPGSSSSSPERVPIDRPTVHVTNTHVTNTHVTTNGPVPQLEQTYAGYLTDKEKRPELEENMAMLVRLGYDRDMVLQALLVVGNRRDEALALLESFSS